MRHTLITATAAGCLWAASTLAAQAQVPGQGALAFTAFNADEDGWAVVALTDLAPGTTIYFTDNEWAGTEFFRDETHVSWQTGAQVIGAGTVVRFSSAGLDPTLSVSVGTLTPALQAPLRLSDNGDTLLAYVGTAANAPVTFLAGISSNGFGAGFGGTLAGTGLTLGGGALQLSSGSDAAGYTGARAGEARFDAYLAPLGALSNWNDRGNGDFAALAPDLTPFSITASVTAVPEPDRVAMLLAGLGALGWVRRRRSA